MKIVIIGCGRTKLTEQAAARDLYTGNLFCARRQYAEQSKCRWWIVSAHHGLVHPITYLSPYDVELRDLKPIDRAAWALQVVACLLDNLEDDTKPSQIAAELHMGADYAEPLLRVLRAIGARDSVWPLKGMAIGEQLAWYKRRAEA